MQPATSSANRYNIYAIIHKALRSFMFDTVTRVGSLDRDDDADVGAAMAQVRDLAYLCRMHLDKENHFVHPAMEARCPASTAQVAADHAEHEHAIVDLYALAEAVVTGSGAARQAALRTLYRHLALFAGDNLLHMDHEETEHNAVLWSAYSDAELAALEQAIVAAIPPQDKMLIMRWMLSAMSREERAEKLAEIRAHAPAPVFAATMELAAATLPAAARRKLEADLDMHTLKAA
ncbi:hypothetical protein GCM10027321_46550 [Massilia terrae]|uniref:Hemerythrin domain-containing protein n=1 Tax=Massilia terrae TaxID=1811224 RepID=A0ABT2D3Y3_9BURK|nr:hemerythrin domain-containing protein [Massilia terrae]MCS0660959.1 hemerythrin domain-containing protein [Massilia terrae]